MDEKVSELAAKMNELDAGFEDEEEERLDPELQRDLCFGVLCERMDKDNYQWGNFPRVHELCFGWDYKFNTSRYREIRYDPNLADEFILSGKEQFRAFMKFCTSVTTLEIRSIYSKFYFDKDVCMTESDPFYQRDQKMFKSEECFFIKTFFKYIKRLVVYEGSSLGLESLYPHLTEMENLEELVIVGRYVDVSPVVRLLKVKQMKTVGAAFTVLEQMDQHMKDYKLEKLLIKSDYIMDDVFNLSNFSPNELHVATVSLKRFKRFADNKTFADTKKLVVDADFGDLNDRENTLCFRLKKMLLVVEPLIATVQRQFPKLEELVFKFSLDVVKYLDLNHEENQWKLCADWCSDFLKEYQGNMDVKFVFVWQESLDRQAKNSFKFMKEQFPDHKFEVIEEDEFCKSIIMYRWKNCCSLAKNVFLDYDVSVRVFQW